MWNRRGAKQDASPALRSLREAVRSHLPDADDDTHAIVVAISGLLLCTAFEDRVFDAAEEDFMRGELGRIRGLPSGGVDAILDALRTHAKALYSEGDHSFARELKERSDRPQRLEVLEILVDLAAVDGVLSLSETNNLRRLTLALGLTPQEYDGIQARHREKLSVLKKT